MAVSKEAPVPNIYVAAAANREALAAAVTELIETIASLPPTTIKRRLREAGIALPANGSPIAITNDEGLYKK